MTPTNPTHPGTRLRSAILAALTATIMFILLAGAMPAGAATTDTAFRVLDRGAIDCRFYVSGLSMNAFAATWLPYVTGSGWLYYDPEFDLYDSSNRWIGTEFGDGRWSDSSGASGNQGAFATYLAYRDSRTSPWTLSSAASANTYTGDFGLTWPVVYEGRQPDRGVTLASFLWSQDPQVRYVRVYHWVYDYTDAQWKYGGYALSARNLSSTWCDTNYQPTTTFDIPTYPESTTFEV